MKTSQAKLQLWSETGAEARLVASRDRRTGEVHFPVFRERVPAGSRPRNDRVVGARRAVQLLDHPPQSEDRRHAVRHRLRRLPRRRARVRPHRRPADRGRASATPSVRSTTPSTVTLRIDRKRERAMSEIYIAGCAMTPFGRHAEHSAPDLAQAAILGALADAGVTRDEIQASYCANVFGGMILGQVVLRDLEMGGPPIYNVENACASGATALHLARHALLAGAIRDCPDLRRRATDAARRRRDPAAAQRLEDRALRERGHGAACGLCDARDPLHRRMRREAGGPGRHRRQESLPRHAQRVRPAAHDDDGRRSAALADDRRSADAPAMLSVAGRRRRGDRADHEAALGAIVRCACSPRWSRVACARSHDDDILDAEITARAARLAYEQAGDRARAIVNVVELHDAFTIAELLYYEALGLAPRGEGFSLLRDGATRLTGRVPVNPSGGLLAKGHPLGATGVAQMVEITWQLQGRAGARQVHGRPHRARAMHRRRHRGRGPRGLGRPRPGSLHRAPTTLSRPRCRRHRRRARDRPRHRAAPERSGLPQ